MRRRLYFVLPDKASVDKIEQELLPDPHRQRPYPFLTTVELNQLPKASLLQSSDLLHGMALD
jgi:hypothetical protein